MTDTGTSGCDSAYTGTDCGYNVDTSTSEMASLFYDTLGNLSFYDTGGSPQAGWGLTNTGPFTNLQSATYWSGTEYAPYTFNKWSFNFNAGNVNIVGKNNNLYALAVRDGDIIASVVPVPAAAWLFGSALLGLGWMRRKA